MYNTETYITTPVGNNELSYSERIALGSGGKIIVPNLVKGNLDDLELGSEIVFEEVNNGKLVPCIGLKHFIETSYAGVPVYIFDNHNHALTFRYNFKKQEAPLTCPRLWVKGETKRDLTVLHIDQHSDIKPNDNICPPFVKEGWCEAPEDLETFVNTKTNVGNFITAALNSGIINEVIQIRTDYALEHFNVSTFQHFNVIVDIDVDFRVGKEITSEQIAIISALIKKAKLVTIATSPYFIDQKEAIMIIKKILQ